MVGLKSILTASGLILAGVLLMEPHRKPPAESPTSIHARHSHGVQEHYRSHAKRLQAYYEALLAALKADAPDLLPLLESPRPPRHGYQVLPQIIAGAQSPERLPRAGSAWYSWPWTEQLITGELKEIVRAEAELERVGALGSRARRSAYEKLARSYSQLRARQRNIDAHIQYNRLWQAAIAANRSAYDRETALHDAVLERQAILDVLNTPNDTAFNKTLTGFKRFDASQSLPEMKAGLMAREKLLARDIHHATDLVSTPAFVHVEQRGPHLWIIHVPFYTDIDDHDFVQAVKDTIEGIWRVRDGADEFRVELEFAVVAAEQLYKDRQPPRMGDSINARQHLALFSPDRAILTTGAITTHVYSRAIILGPHDIAPRVLAHEFGHILGFKDTYFRGYKDLGRNGFQVMEVVAEPNNIMGAPAIGPVLREHFEKILRHSAGGKSPRRLNSL